MNDYQNAIDRIREHLTTLHANPDIYEDGTCNVIYALEAFAIPALEKQIYKEPVIKRSSAEYGREYYACPNPDCGEYIRYKYTLDERPLPERCRFCGQALEWD